MEGSECPWAASLITRGPAFARRFDLLRLGYRNWRIRCEAGRDFVNTLARRSLH